MHPNTNYTVIPHQMAVAMEMSIMLATVATVATATMVMVMVMATSMIAKTSMASTPTATRPTMNTTKSARTKPTSTPMKPHALQQPRPLLLLSLLCLPLYRPNRHYLRSHAARPVLAASPQFHRSPPA